MSEIEIVYDMPVIFTKDKQFIESNPSAKPGSIILLPEDAVLYVPRETYEVTQAENFPLTVKLPSEHKASKKASQEPHPQTKGD